MERYKNFNRFLDKKVLTVQPAYCRGYLYQLPIGFPGLVTMEGCEDLVVGELMTFRQPVRTMRALDMLEGYYPDNLKKSIYQRRKLPVIAENLKDGKAAFSEVEAWVYTYPLDHLSPAHQKAFFISCGNWKLLSQVPVKKAPRRLSKLFRRLQAHPEPERVHIEPAFCMDEASHAGWRLSTACSGFCKNPEHCRRNRRKRSDNFSCEDGD